MLLITEYLTKLLNQPIASDTAVNLSSAQRARFYNWLKIKNIIFQQDLLRSTFSVNKLLGSNVTGSASVYSIITTQQNEQSTHSSNRLLDQIGVDIQKISELFPDGLSLDPKRDRELTKLFTMKELSYAQSKFSPLETLTGIFAAKEALIKCLDIDVQQPFDFTTLEILPDLTGRPIIEGCILSISHSGEYAIAIAYKSNQIQKLRSQIDEIDESKKQDYLLTTKKIRFIDIVMLLAIVTLFGLMLLHYNI